MRRPTAIAFGSCRDLAQRLPGRWLLLAVALLAVRPAFAAPGDNKPPLGNSFPVAGGDSGSITNFYTYYRDHYLAEKKRFQAATNDYAAAWQFGRACFDLGEVATNDTERAAVAEQGIAICRLAVNLQPKHAAGHYYLGMNLGQLARTKMLSALKLVSEMERAFQVARALDAKFDYAGSDRCLGLLYRDAPGWPISVGNKKQARLFLQQAVTVAADYPDNQLNLAEAFVLWDEKAAAVAKLKAIQAAMVKARTNLVGDDWVASWRDWTNRWQTLTNRLAK